MPANVVGLVVSSATTFAALLLLQSALIALPTADGVPQAANSACSPSTCDVFLVANAALSEEGHPGVIPANLPFVVEDRGRYLMYARQRDRLIVFDSNGRIVRTAGQRGEAQGQYGRIDSIHATADSILVYDIGLRRLTILDRELKVRRIVPMAQGPDLILRDGSFLVAEQIPTPDLVGYPLHVVGLDGRVIRSFGAETPQFRADMRLFTDRVVAMASDGTVWAAAPGKYLFERWDPATGERAGQLALASGWFKDSVRPQRDERLRPTPRIEGLWEQNHLLWVLARDADSRWTPPAQANIERDFNLAEYNSTYDWIVEVIDPARNGRLVASRRLADVHYVHGPSRLLVSRKANRAGEPVVLDTWKAELKPKERQQ